MQIVYCVSCSETSPGLLWINSLIFLFFIAWSLFSLFYLEKKDRWITWLHGAELYTECAFSIIFVTNINKNQPCTARGSISCLPGGSEPVLLCIARLCICNVISRGAVSPVAWTSYPAVSNSASSILAIVARFRSHLKKHFNYTLEISWEVFVYKLDKQPGVHTELYKLSVKYEHGLIIKSSY